MKKLVSLSLIVGLSACAAVVEGSKQTINLGSNLTEKGECTLRDKQGVMYSASIPGSVEVNRGDGPLRVSCTVAGGHGERSVAETVEPWIFGNLFIPLIWPLTFGYDAVSGSYQRYPDEINVSIVQDTMGVAPISGGGLPTTQPLGGAYAR